MFIFNKARGLFFPTQGLIASDPLPASVFNYSNQEHLNFINSRVDHFNQALNGLRPLIFKMALGCAVGLAGWSVSWISVAVLGFTYAASQYDERGAALIDTYLKAYVELKRAYQWSMPKGTSHWDSLGTDSIQALILALGPVSPPAEICSWTEADLTPASVLNLVDKRNEPSNSFKERLASFARGDQYKTLDYILYSHNGLVGQFASTQLRLRQFTHSAAVNGNLTVAASSNQP